MEDKVYNWFCRFCKVFELTHFDEQVKIAELSPYEVKELNFEPDILTGDRWVFFNDGEPSKHLICYKTGMSTPSYIFQGTPNDYKDLLQKAKTNDFKVIPLSVQLIATFVYEGKPKTSAFGHWLSYGPVEIISRDEVQWDDCDEFKPVRANINGFFVQCVCFPVEKLEKLLAEFDESITKKNNPTVLAEKPKTGYTTSATRDQLDEWGLVLDL